MFGVLWILFTWACFKVYALKMFVHVLALAIVACAQTDDSGLLPTWKGGFKYLVLCRKNEAGEEKLHVFSCN